MDSPVVLAVEDSDSDFFLMEMVLNLCLDRLQILRASDGEQAVSFFSEANISESVQRPDLVLLDVNLPRVNGFEVLQFMKQHDLIRDIPVVVFTSSDDKREKLKAFAMGAQDFITKPLNFGRMKEVLEGVCLKYLAAPNRLAT